MRTVFAHPILSLDLFPVETRTGPAEYVRLRMPPWVNVVPITEQGEVVLVRQHRWGVQRETLEVPGGLVEPGEGPEEAARRELLEETGYGGGSWSLLADVLPNPAIQDNTLSLWLALGVRRVAEPAFDPGESITVERRPWADVPGWVARGEVSHALAGIALLLAWERHKESSRSTVSE